jgi:hypothetical protein
MLENLIDLVDQLKRNPRVLGIVRYGRRSPVDLLPGGDFDLFVFVEERLHDVESIHFHCGGIPVDLSLRTIEDLLREEPLSRIDRLLGEAEVLYDRTGKLREVLADLNERWRETPPEPTEHDVHMNRFYQQHTLDKVKGRTEKEPLLCEFLLATNIYWLVQAYFRVRSISYPGEKPALQYLESHEAEMCAEMQAFYSSHDINEKLKISERMTELVLAPIGGPWRRGELIVFGMSTNTKQLQSKGQEIFLGLFGVSAEKFLSR